MLSQPYMSAVCVINIGCLTVLSVNENIWIKFESGHHTVLAYKNTPQINKRPYKI